MLSIFLIKNLYYLCTFVTLYFCNFCPFATPLVMLSTKNKDPMMNYVITNNPKMLIKYLSSHGRSIYGSPSCSGLLFMIIFCLLINVFVRFRSTLLLLGTRILNDLLQQYYAYRCAEQ